MLLIIISALISIVIGLFFTYDSSEYEMVVHKTEYITFTVKFIAMLFVGFLLAGLGIAALVSYGVEPCCDCSYKAGNIISTQEISSLANRSSVSGNFSLGYGHMGNCQVYSVCIKDGEDYSITSLDADKTVLRSGGKIPTIR